MGKWDLGNIRLAIQHGFEFLTKLASHRPNIVYVPISQNFPGFLRDCLFILPAIWAHRNLVIHLHGGYFRTFYETSPFLVKWLICYILASTASVIVLGESLRFIFAGLIADERIVVIPNGLNPKPFERATYQKRGMGYQVTYLGNLIESKGYRNVLKAAALIRERRQDVSFTLAGAIGESDEPYWSQQFVQERHLQDAVVFSGVVVGDAKVELLISSDIFVFPPYSYEGHPLVVLEAMAAGLPIITTNQGAIRETVIDGVNGFIVPKNDPAAIAEKVLLLLQDVELRRCMGAASRERFKTHYTLDSMIQRIAQVFEQVESESQSSVSTVHKS